MTISAHASGTQTATVGTEHFLTSPNVEGKFTGIVDVSNMADGDALELRAYQMVLSGGTARVIDIVYLYGAQPTDQLIIEWGKEIKNELTDTNAVRYSLKQTAGTGRNFPWKVVKETTGAGGGGATAQEIWDFALTSISTAGSIGKLIEDNLDAAISSRLASASYTTPPTAGAIADAVWDEDATAHQTQGTFGQAIGDPGADTDTIFGLVNSNLDAAVSSRSTLSAAQVNSEVDTALADIHLDHLLANTYDPAAKPGAADALLNELVESDAGVSRFTANALEQAPTGSGGGATPTQIWDHLLTNITTSGSIGKLLKDNVDAAISSRSSHSAADVWASATRSLTDKAGFSLSSAGVQAIWDFLTSSISAVGSVGVAILNALDTNIGSRLSAAGYTAPDNASITSIKNVTDQFVGAQSEPTTAPAANATPLQKIAYIFAALRNKMTVTSSAKTFYKDDGTTLWSKSLSDDGTTYTENEGS
jgi:hypothetical protein